MQTDQKKSRTLTEKKKSCTPTKKKSHDLGLERHTIGSYATYLSVPAHPANTTWVSVGRKKGSNLIANFRPVDHLIPLVSRHGLRGNYETIETGVHTIRLRCQPERGTSSELIIHLSQGQLRIAERRMY